MSFRVYVHTKKDGIKYQCLGNNEFPQVLEEELKKQGCEIDEDGCFYNFEIKDLQGIIEALEQYIFEKHFKIEGGIADFTYVLDQEKHFDHLTHRMEHVIECGYLFISYNFLKAIGKENYDFDWIYDDEGSLKAKPIYKVVEGKHIYMSGY